MMSEALAAGVPVRSRLGGLEEQLVHGETGWLVEPDSVDALESALRTALENPRDFEEMGQRGRAHAADHLDIQITADRYRGLYERVLAAQCE